MLPLYDVNGLVFWTEREIRIREQLTAHYAAEIQAALSAANPAWRFVRVEAPLLTPRRLISGAYGNADVWVQEAIGPSAAELVLRPETTPGSYAYLRHLLDGHSGARPPLCVWQAGKSFRREQEQPYRHVRLKEFWQMEFQCLYTADTKNDYHAHVLEPVRRMLAETLCLPTRVVPSDRLPAYSEVTMDVEVDNGDKWMEVCSISRRVDFPGTWGFPSKSGPREVGLRVLEVAIGLDRCVHNVQRRSAAA